MTAVATLDRFWAKVAAPSDADCWTWTASTNDRGYGRFGYTSEDRVVHVYAHRYAYEALVGPIPVGLTVDHTCLNIACVNPAHMELVTKSENTARRWRRSRATR